ncbi:DoxX family protein [uncultured Algoriphagus sp.]|uniref:DoxX family protein n=1 Tax=uncultured Algoriphagus sp. TaxID=417365 RepID=UPI0030ED6B94|tara:strand:+ start:15368 stop:15754 length:387 start_codon:yes stop_codon:yes gene_type:complete
MDSTKRDKIIFWTATSFIFLFEGVMPALTSQTDLAKQGVQHLGYPMYFGNTLVVFKVCGTLILMIPKFPKRVKEWAYAGFTFDFIFACISHYAVDGFGFNAIFPLIILAILMVSYVYFHKLNPELKTS